MMSTDYKTTPAAQPTGRRITIPDAVPARYRSRTLKVKLPDYIWSPSRSSSWPIKRPRRKRKLSSDLRPCCKLREAVGRAGEESDGISDATGNATSLL
jgi:hypothetical protein